MEKSEEKPPPAALGSQHCLPGDGSIPSWPECFNGAHSGHLSHPGLVLPSRAGWQHLGRMQEAVGGDTKSFPLWSKKWRRRCMSPHLPGALPADNQTLTGAVLNPEDTWTSKASRFELRSRCPSQLEEPRSSFRRQAGSMKNQ